MSEEKISKPLKIVRSQDYRTFYVEGLSQVRLGAPVSRFMLRSLAAEQAENMVHQVECEIVMPTGALADLALQIISLLKDKKEIASTANVQMNKSFDAVMKIIEKTDLDGYVGQFQVKEE